MKRKYRIMGVVLAGLMAFAAAPEIAEPLTISASAAAAKKLAAPKGFSASIADTNAKITWKAVKGAVGYRVFLYNAKTKRYETYKNVSTPTCKFKDLKPGVTYKIKVAALKKNGKEYELQTLSGKQVFTTKLPAPKNLKTEITQSHIKLSWSAVKGASAYRVYTYDPTTKKYVTYKNMSGTTCTITDFEYGKTYKFKVAALVKSGKEYKAQLQTDVVKAVVPITEVAPKEHVSGYNYGSTKYPFKHDINYMKQLNSDFIGWLQIKDTPIDLPVVQASNNDYYLTHTFYGEYDYTKVGTTFADSHSPVTKNFRPDNLVIYGHNIRTGVGLAKITNYYPARYGSLNFYLTHPTFTYESVYGGEKTYVVFAGMFVNTETKHGSVFNYYRFRNFKSEDTFYQYFEQVFDRSVFYNPDLDIKYGDKFLTLSTCFYPMGADVDTRFVVFARELRPGETTVSTKNAYTNKSPLYFDYYYKVNGGKWAGRNWSESLMQGYSEWKKS
ncbi:MAG: fibronectin type III domain-containing protein [Ruminiclostridium sp.]|nr:fibronectin type III domain-containing protein [Ruminiclostridium sp.]